MRKLSCVTENILQDGYTAEPSIHRGQLTLYGIFAPHHFSDTLLSMGCGYKTEKGWKMPVVDGFCM